MYCSAPFPFVFTSVLSTCQFVRLVEAQISYLRSGMPVSVNWNGPLAVRDGEMSSGGALLVELTMRVLV